MGFIVLRSYTTVNPLKTATLYVNLKPYYFYTILTMGPERLTGDLVEAALRGDIILATAEGKEAAIQALEIEKAKAQINQQSMGRSGDGDVIDLREDNAFMQARNQATVHNQRIIEIRKHADAIVVESFADAGILPLGTEFMAIVIYTYGDGKTEEKIQHCKLGGPCEHLYLKSKPNEAAWISYRANFGKAIWRADLNSISTATPLEFTIPHGKAQVIAFTLV